jgi:hypothetical protein
VSSLGLPSLGHPALLGPGRDGVTIVARDTLGDS